SVSSKRRPASRSLVAALFRFQGPTRANSPATRFVRMAVTVARGELSRRRPHYVITSPSLLQRGLLPGRRPFARPRRALPNIAWPFCLCTTLFAGWAEGSPGPAGTAFRRAGPRLSAPEPPTHQAGRGHAAEHRQGQAAKPPSSQGRHRRG